MKSIKRMIKQVLKLFGERIVIKCKRGPLKDFKLLAVVPMRFLKGSYEIERTKMFLKVVKNRDVVYDIGAHMGFYTLIASRIVGSSGRVIAFEPCPYNLRILRRHLEINGISNVDIIPAAVSERSGRSKFAFGTGTGTGRLANDGEIEVEVISIDELKGLPQPNVIKIDVEGEEVKVIKGAIKTIQNSYPIIFLAAHNKTLLQDADKLLIPLGYRRYVLKMRDKGDIEVVYLPIYKSVTEEL